MFCTKCGSAYTAGTAFCPSCGNPVVSAAASPIPVATALPPAPNPYGAAPVAPYASPSPAMYAQAVTYGGFWARFAAYLIDGLITSVAMLILIVPLALLTGAFAGLGTLGRQPGREPNPAAVAAAGAAFALIFLFAAIAIVVSWLYHAYLESGPKQGTWGKSAMGLYVTDMAGQRISFARATGRFFSKIITGMIPLLLGYIMAAFTERRQALHDMIASTVVLKR